MTKTRNKYRQIAVALFLLAVLMFVNSGRIYASAVLVTENNFQTGLVDIDLKQYQELENGRLIPAETSFNNILPGDTFYQKARVTCNADDCYIRLSDTWTRTDFVTSTMTADGWTHGRDGYWYFTNVLKEGEYADIDFTYHMDIRITETLAETISETLRAEAVQAKNFTPDFTADMPWGSVEIIESIYDSGYKKPEGSQELTVTYKGGAEGLISNTKDAFTNFGILMPGDVYTDRLIIRNTNSSPAEIYFKTELPNFAARDLYDAVRISIEYVTSAGVKTQIYNGRLSKCAVDEMLLAKVGYGEKGNLIYNLSLPAEADNRLSVLEGKINFIFTVKEVPAPTPAPTATPAPSTTTVSGGSGTVQVTPVEYGKGDGPKTGDISMAIYYAMGGMSLLAAALIFKRKADEEKANAGNP